MKQIPPIWICKKCGPLTSEKFLVQKASCGSKDNLRIKCRACLKVYTEARLKAKREEDPHYSGKLSRKWRADNPERWKELRKDYYERHSNEISVHSKEERIERRLVVLRYYSGSDIPACALCGEDNISLLVIDHIDGGGNKHRKEIKRKSDKFYQWLVVNKFPGGFRVLCHNCNHSLSIRGTAPEKSFSGFIWPDFSNLPTEARYRLIERLVCLLKYGNNDPRCACCGLSNYEYLVIDHIDGGGCKHRKENKLNGRLIYHWLIQNNFPPGFRILCFNCNFSFGVHKNCAHMIENPILNDVEKNFI
ncbi:MAG: hypothetical protein WC708_00065 [Lentisphaeria bacterium]